MNKETFAEIKLLNGDSCVILNITPFVFWKAGYKYGKAKGIECDMTPFLLQEILLFNGEKKDIDYIGNLFIDDYIKIMEVLSAIMNKLPIK